MPSPAQYNVGVYYAKGKGVDQSFTKAREWWTKAAAQGYEDAIGNLKILDKHEGRTTTTSSTTVTDNTYEDGDFSLKQSVTKANELYALAAEKGHANARYNLGYNYHDGIGVEIDYNRCVELYEESAKQGDVDAQFNLCNLYRTGSQDNENGNPMTIPKNLPLHFKWALAAAKQDHVGGQRYTAECYEEGWAFSFCKRTMLAC